MTNPKRTKRGTNKPPPDRDAIAAFAVSLREKGNTYRQIAEAVNKKFKKNMTAGHLHYYLAIAGYKFSKKNKGKRGGMLKVVAGEEKIPRRDIIAAKEKLRRYWVAGRLTENQILALQVYWDLPYSKLKDVEKKKKEVTHVENSTQPEEAAAGDHRSY